MPVRKKICFVLPSLAGGGAERAAVQILNALDSGSWDRSMFLFRREGPYVGEVANQVQLAWSPRPSRFGRWRALRRFLRKTRPDLVVSFLSYFSVLTAVRSAGVGARVIFNQQTPMSAFLADPDYLWRRPLLRWFFSLVMRLAYAAADMIVTTSRGVAEDVAASLRVRSDRIQVVHNPVDLEAINSLASEPLPAAHATLWCRPVIVAAGRLAEAKNYPLLIEAVALLRERMAVRLFILGQGDQETRLRELLVARGLRDVVQLAGFQKNPWRYIARADVFAVSSRYEGFGNVLIEAMACGVPVVATSSPGTQEIVNDGVDGLLVEDHLPRALAAALERILTDPQFRHRLATNARAGANRFALPVVARRYDALFAEALA